MDSNKGREKAENWGGKTLASRRHRLTKFPRRICRHVATQPALSQHSRPPASRRITKKGDKENFRDCFIVH